MKRAAPSQLLCLGKDGIHTFHHHFSSNTRPHGLPPWALKMSAGTPDTIHRSIAKRGPAIARYRGGHALGTHAVALPPKRWRASEALSLRYCLDLRIARGDMGGTWGTMGGP